MDKYELLLKDLEAILNSIGGINKVSHGKVAPIDQEDTFTAVYISPDMDSFEGFVAGTNINSYTNTFYIRLTVNMDCTGDELLWVSIRRKIIDSILSDTAIWSNILDRDVVSIAYDDYGSYPRKSMAMLFEFKLREECIV